MIGNLFGLARKKNVDRYREGSEPLKMMVVDIDCVSQRHFEKNNGYVKSHEQSVVFRLLGVTEDGSSLACTVHNFEPYLYALPLDKNLTRDDLNFIRISLNYILGTPENAYIPPEVTAVLEKFMTSKQMEVSEKLTNLNSPVVPVEPKSAWKDIDELGNATYRNHMPEDGYEKLFPRGKKRKKIQEKDDYDSNSDDSADDDGDCGPEDDPTFFDDEAGEMDIDNTIPEMEVDMESQIKSVKKYEYVKAKHDSKARKTDSSEAWISPTVVQVDLVMREGLFGYDPNGLKPYLKIVTNNPRKIPTVKSLIQKGLSVFGLNWERQINLHRQVFEANIEFVQRFMVDKDIRGFGWVTIKRYDGPSIQNSKPPSGMVKDSKPNDAVKLAGGGRFAPKDEYWPGDIKEAYKLSGAGFGMPEMIHVNECDLMGIDIALKEGKCSAPLRICSYDIECMGLDGRFPEPSLDPIITIAIYLDLQDQKRKLGIVFQLGSMNLTEERKRERKARENQLREAAEKGVEPSGEEKWIYLSYDREIDLLRSFSSIIRLVDPDVMTGYNIDDFDMPYILGRMKQLGLPDAACLGRIRGERMTRKVSVFTSRAHGTKVNTIISTTGRPPIDVISCLQRNEKLSNYTLNFTSELYTGKKKIDLDHKEIAPNQAGGTKGRTRIATYCRTDAILPLDMLAKLMYLVRNIELARITGIPLQWILQRGQGVMVMSQISRVCLKRGIVIPTLERSGSSSSNAEEETYEGATVIEPERGYYDYPVATLDFASLYPSIMMAAFLCYFTWVMGGVKAAKEMGLKGPDKYGDRLDNKPIEGDDYLITAFEENVFVLPHKRVGVLPKILEDLIAARKEAKKELEAATDPVTIATLDGRQFSIKVSANSIYGFAGASVGKLPCRAISASVTALGRDGLFLTKQVVEQQYPGAKIIYGDTDSVMIIFPEDPGFNDRAAFKHWAIWDTATQEQKDEFHAAMDRVMKKGKEAAGIVTKRFSAPMKLEFEKVYYPYLLVNKKRYAGLLWEKFSWFKKMDVKGLETKRRDNCKLARDLQGNSLNIMLKKGSVTPAINYVKEEVSKLVKGEIDISMLSVTKKLTCNPYIDVGKPGAYKNYQVHAELSKKLQKRDALACPSIGDRVPYVITKGSKDSKVYQRGEDPVYALYNDSAIDYTYYLEKQCVKPLSRVFSAVMDEKKINELFNGPHTRFRIDRVNSNDPLAKFLSKVSSCRSCKQTIPTEAEDQGLCESCQNDRPKVQERFSEENKKRRTAEKTVWDECATCRPTDFESCTNTECKIWFKRYKVRNDSQKSTDACKLLKVDLSW